MCLLHQRKQILISIISQILLLYSLTSFKSCYMHYFEAHYFYSYIVSLPRGGSILVNISKIHLAVWFQGSSLQLIFHPISSYSLFSSFIFLVFPQFSLKQTLLDSTPYSLLLIPFIWGSKVHNSKPSFFQTHEKGGSHGTVPKSVWVEVCGRHPEGPPPGM